MKIGIIGAGSIAQIMHIPYLAELPEVDLHAIADPGSGVIETIGERYNIEHQYERNNALIEELSDKLDAVVIATPMHTHAEVAVASLEANLHTFVEKPVAVTPGDAQDVIDAANSTDANCMVGYMKRYDPSFQMFVEEVNTKKSIDLITTIIIPPNINTILNETYDLAQADLSDEFIQESFRRRQSQLETAIGTNDDVLTHAYEYHLESICHDINALRAIFGIVESIDHVDIFNNGGYMTAQLRYEDDYRCLFESGKTDRKWYDERIRVDGPDRSVEISFGNAFIRNDTSEVQVRRGTSEITDTIYEPSYDEAFKKELSHFLDCIKKDIDPLTPPKEAKRDVELIARLFREFGDNRSD